MGNKLYVGNLAYSVRDDDLQQAFAQFGTVSSAKVMMDRDTGRSKEQLHADMVTDHYLFGQEIIDYGLADGYYEPPQPSRRPRSSRRIPETFERPLRVKDSE